MSPTLHYQLITQILEEAKWDWSSWQFDCAGRERAQLCRFSLVAKAWKAPAQAMLWRNVKLESEQTGERCSASAALGRYTTRSLTCKGVQGKAVVKVVQACRGMQELTLDSVSTNVPAALLGIRSLAGLTSLDLNQVKLTGDLPTSLLFQLHHLAVRHDVVAETDLIRLLATHSPLLTHLNLNRNFHAIQISHLLSPLAPHLLLLELPLLKYPRLSALDVVVYEQLRRCDHLVELIINSDESYMQEVDSDVGYAHPSDDFEAGEDREVVLEHPAYDILAALPPTGTLGIRCTRYGQELNVEELDDLKGMLSLPALRRLRKLYLTETALYGLDDVDEEGEFEEWCKERGIEVFVSEVTEETRSRYGGDSGEDGYSE